MKRISILLLALIMLTTLFACGQPPATSSPSPSADATPTPSDVTGTEPTGSQNGTVISVTDQTGNVITLDAPATKIVVLTPALCEIIYALGVGDMVVGRGTYCDFPAEVVEIAEVGSGDNTNVEQILALEPDLVMMATMAQNEGQSQQIIDAGIPVYSSEATGIEETYESIIQIGALLGKDAEAATLVDSMKSTFSELQSEPRSGSIYFEVSPPYEGGVWTAGTGSFMHEIAELLGLTNIFADIEGWAEVSEEQVLERNPDYIVTITMVYDGGPNPVDEIKSRTAWQEVTAVKNSAILNMPNNELARPSPRLVDGAKALHDFTA